MFNAFFTFQMMSYNRLFESFLSKDTTVFYMTADSGCLWRCTCIQCVCYVSGHIHFIEKSDGIAKTLIMFYSGR